MSQWGRGSRLCRTQLTGDESFSYANTRARSSTEKRIVSAQHQFQSLPTFARLVTQRRGVRYKARSLVMTFANRTNIPGEFLSRGGRVLPGAVSEFWLQMPLEPPVSTFPATGRVQFEFEYSDDLGRQGHPIVGTVEHTLSSAAPNTPMLWGSVDEPSAP